MVVCASSASQVKRSELSLSVGGDLTSTPNFSGRPLACFEEEVGAQPQTPGEGLRPFTIPLLLALLIYEWISDLEA